MPERERDSKSYSLLYSQLIAKRNEMLASLFGKLNSDRREFKEVEASACNKR